MSLEDQIMLDVEAWKPEPGESIVGTVLSVATNEAGYGDYPLLEIQLKDGSVVQWHAFDTVAKNDLAKYNVARGDQIAARFLGEQKKKDGGSYKGWRVLVEKATGEVEVPNWQSIADDARAEGVDNFEPFPDDEPEEF